MNVKKNCKTGAINSVNTSTEKTVTFFVERLQPFFYSSSS